MPTETRAEKDIKLGKLMFFVGLPALPWMWVANLLYFRKRWAEGKLPAEAIGCALHCVCPHAACTARCHPPISTHPGLKLSMVGVLVWVIAIVAWIVAYQVERPFPGLAVWAPPRYWFWNELPWKWTSGIRSDFSSPDEAVA